MNYHQAYITEETSFCEQRESHFLTCTPYIGQSEYYNIPGFLIDVYLNVNVRAYLSVRDVFIHPPILQPQKHLRRLLLLLHFPLPITLIASSRMTLEVRTGQHNNII